MLVVLVFNLTIAGATIYIVGSAATSFAKVAAGNCSGGKIGLEKVFSGNWFCPEK